MICDMDAFGFVHCGLQPFSYPSSSQCVCFLLRNGCQLLRILKMDRRVLPSKLCPYLGGLYGDFAAIGVDLLVCERKRKTLTRNFLLTNCRAVQCVICLRLALFQYALCPGIDNIPLRYRCFKAAIRKRNDPDDGDGPGCRITAAFGRAVSVWVDMRCALLCKFMEGFLWWCWIWTTENGETNPMRQTAEPPFLPVSFYHVVPAIAG